METVLKILAIMFRFGVDTQSEREANESVSRFAQKAMQQLRNLGTVAATIAFDRIVQNLLKATSQAEDTAFVFENIYGDLSDAQAAWAEEFADTYNRSATKVKKFLAEIQHEMVGFTKAGTEEQKRNAAELSKAIEETALNLGVFYGMDTKTAISTLMSAVEGSEGAMDTLRVGQGTTLAARRQEARNQLVAEGAIAYDATYQNLSKYEKALVNLRAVMLANGDAADALARSQLNYSTMQANLNESLEELRELLGEFFLPTAKVITDYAIRIVRHIKDSVEQIKKLTDAIGITEPLITGLSAALAVLVAIQVADWLANILGGLKLIAMNPAFLMLAAAIGLVIAAIRLFNSESTGLKKIASVVLGALSLLAAGFLVLKTAALTSAAAQGVLNAVMAAFPGTWIIAIIVAVIAALALLVKNWDKVKEGFAAAQEWIQERRERIAQGFENFRDKVSGAFDTVKDKLGAFRDRVASTWNSMPAWMKVMAAALLNPVGAIVALIRHFGELKDEAGNAIDSVKARVESIRKWFQDQVDAVRNFFNAVFDWLRDKLNSIPDWMLVFGGPIGWLMLLVKHFDAVKQAAKEAWEWIQKAVYAVQHPFNPVRDEDKDKKFTDTVANILDWTPLKVVGDAMRYFGNGSVSGSTLAMAGGTYNSGNRNVTQNITFNQAFNGPEAMEQKTVRAAENFKDDSTGFLARIFGSLKG